MTPEDTVTYVVAKLEAGHYLTGYVRINHAWTPTEIKRLCDLRHEKRSVLEIAKCLNRSPNAIKGKIAALRKTGYILPSHKKGRPAAEPTMELLQQIEKIRLLRLEGKAIKNIAYSIGKSRTWVQRLIRKYGLPKRFKLKSP